MQVENTKLLSIILHKDVLNVVPLCTLLPLKTLKCGKNTMHMVLNKQRTPSLVSHIIKLKIKRKIRSSLDYVSNVKVSVVTIFKIHPQ